MQHVWLGNVLPAGWREIPWANIRPGDLVIVCAYEESLHPASKAVAMARKHPTLAVVVKTKGQNIQGETMTVTVLSPWTTREVRLNVNKAFVPAEVL